MTGVEPVGGRLAAVLHAFGVTAVMAVDDGDRDTTIDHEIEAARIEAGDSDIGPLLELSGVPALLEERGIDAADEEQARSVIAEALRAGEISLGPPSDTGDDDTASAFESLRTLLDEVGLPFEVVPFGDWAGPGSVDASTLVLFDFRDGDTPAGARLAVDYAKSVGSEAHVAILSQEQGEERDLWAAHLVAMDAEVARQIAWIPKGSLRAAPEAIVEQMAVALCAPVVRDLRADSLDSLRSALDDTEAATASLSPYELHMTTVGSAINDGHFEPESLVNRFARRSVPFAMASLQLDDAVHTSIRSLRDVQEKHLLPNELTGALVTLQKEDYYIDRSLLIGRHQGAVPGDIFAIVPPEVLTASFAAAIEPDVDPLAEALGDLSDLSLCILVAQPCDLAVRTDGTRAATGRSLEALPLETGSGDERMLMGHGITSKRHVFRLPWLAGIGPSSHRRAIFKSPLAIPTLAVDACTWSALDAACMVAGGTVTGRCSMNWQRRHVEALIEADGIEQACAVANSLGDDGQDVARKIMLDAAASDERIGFAYSAEARLLAWGLVRVARLRSPYVESLLTTYNDFRRRDAFPASLA